MLSSLNVLSIQTIYGLFKTDLWFIWIFWKRKVNRIKDLVATAPNTVEAKPVGSDFAVMCLCGGFQVMDLRHFRWIGLSNRNEASS